RDRAGPHLAERRAGKSPATVRSTHKRDASVAARRAAALEHSGATTDDADGPGIVGDDRQPRVERREDGAPRRAAVERAQDPIALRTGGGASVEDHPDVVSVAGELWNREALTKRRERPRAP